MDLYLFKPLQVPERKSTMILSCGANSAVCAASSNGEITRASTMACALFKTLLDTGESVGDVETHGANFRELDLKW